MIYVAGPITEYRSGRDVGPFVEVAMPYSGSFRTMQHHVDQALDRVFSPYGLRLVTGGGLPTGTDPWPAYDVEVRERSEPSPRCRDEARECAVLAITADARDWAWDRSLETDEPLLLQSPEHRWSPERATAFVEAFSGHEGDFSAGVADLDLEEYGIKALLHRCGPMDAVANAIEIYAAKDDLVRLADEIRKIITGAGHYLR